MGVSELDLPPTEPDSTTSTFLTFGAISSTDAKAITAQLANQAAQHALTPRDIPSNYLHISLLTVILPNDSMGLCLILAFSTKSTAGYGQFMAYKATFGDIRLDTSTAGSVNAQFGIGSTVFIGSIDIKSPIGCITFHIVRADTPFLLCLQDMDSLDIYFNNLEDLIVCGETSFPVVRTFGHPFLVWGPVISNFLTSSLDSGLPSGVGSGFLSAFGVHFLLILNYGDCIAVLATLLFTGLYESWNVLAISTPRIAKLSIKSQSFARSARNMDALLADSNSLYGTRVLRLIILFLLMLCTSIVLHSFMQLMKLHASKLLDGYRD